MNSTNLISKIQNGSITISEISTGDFKALMQNPETQCYGLMLCGQAYCGKATQMLNTKMDKIGLNDSTNMKIIAETYDIIRIDNHGQLYFNSAACSLRFGQYLTELLNSMVNVETGQINYFQVLVNFFNIKKDIVSITINKNISEKCDQIKNKYINSDSSSKYNISSVLQKGWDQLNKEMRSEEMIESLDYCDSVEELFELSVSTIGSLDSMLSSFEKDVEELKVLLEKRKKYL